MRVLVVPFMFLKGCYDVVEYYIKIQDAEDSYPLGITSIVSVENV